ncbi:hypothetical protein BKA58DRAFT_144405 [Alternaria rosae]|uniref:uncharacterized protein n=1 Tax=Alternaria rosae TaxID=1187941 RepID=UPI001E8CD909|nr:uncharacterized protein BKA58DRAFT_144405 [Alternaria rosae]KAH6872372.1 hypothetical protein BKA58DRAFT_144405 [Alternaria rosae]
MHICKHRQPARTTHLVVAQRVGIPLLISCRSSTTGTCTKKTKINIPNVDHCNVQSISRCDEEESALRLSESTVALWPTFAPPNRTFIATISLHSAHQAEHARKVRRKVRRDDGCNLQRVLASHTQLHARPASQSNTVDLDLLPYTPSARLCDNWNGTRSGCLKPPLFRTCRLPTAPVARFDQANERSLRRSIGRRNQQRCVAY